MQVIDYKKFTTRFPEESELWQYQTAGFRVRTAAWNGLLFGGLASTFCAYWYDVPATTAQDTYFSAAKKTAVYLGRSTLLFAGTCVIFQLVVEATNHILEKRTALGPFLGSFISISLLGAALKKPKMGIKAGIGIGVLTTIVGHFGFFQGQGRMRERMPERYEAAEKFRYLSDLETKESRNVARINELEAYRKFEL